MRPKWLSPEAWYVLWLMGWLIGACIADFRLAYPHRRWAAVIVVCGVGYCAARIWSWYRARNEFSREFGCRPAWKATRVAYIAGIAERVHIVLSQAAHKTSWANRYERDYGLTMPRYDHQCDLARRFWVTPKPYYGYLASESKSHAQAG